MASKKVNIQIDTKANTSGAKEVEVAVDKMVDSVEEAEIAVEDLTDAVNKLDGKLDDVDNSTKVVDRAVDGLTDSVVKLDDRVTDTAQATDKLDDALHVVETSGKGAARSIDAVAQASDRAATSTAKSTKGVASAGQIAQSAGYQVQDFAVQVAGGTSALTAMAQQAPQFLGVFGPGGAIAGALIAVGAIALKVFNGMADDSANAEEKAAFLAEAIKEVSDTASKAVGEDIDFGLKQIDDAATAALNLIGAFDGVTDAANAAALATLSNAEKIRKAEIEIRKLRGEQVDEIKEIAAATEAESAMRQEQARQAIAAENTKVEQAKAAEVIAQQALDLKLQEKATTQANLLTENQKLGVLRAQRDALAEQAKERGKISEGEIPFMKTPAAEQAQKQLDDQFLQASIALAEKNVAVLEAKAKEITDQLSENATAVNSAMTAVAANSQEVAISIPRIAESFQAEEIKAQVGGLVEIGQQAAKEIGALVENVKPANTGQAVALESLKTATADGQITANETAKVAAALQTLNGVIGTNMTTSSANVQALIQAVTTLNQRTIDQKRQIDSINARIRSGN